VSTSDSDGRAQGNSHSPETCSALQHVSNPIVVIRPQDAPWRPILPAFRGDTLLIAIRLTEPASAAEPISPPAPPWCTFHPDSPDCRRQRPGAGDRAEACLGHPPTRQRFAWPSSNDAQRPHWDDRWAFGPGGLRRNGAPPRPFRPRPDRQPHSRRKSNLVFLQLGGHAFMRKRYL